MRRSSDKWIAQYVKSEPEVYADSIDEVSLN